MTAEDHDRLVVLENEFTHMKITLGEIRGDLGEIKKAAHMGRGAWAIMLRIGGGLVILGTGFAWLWDHVLKK